MALFSNNMWQTEEMSPKKGVKNNPHTTTDSFVGAPLAVGSDSPPAGPVSQSVQMAGAMEGWQESTTLGKGIVIGSTLLTTMAMMPKKKTIGGVSASIAGGYSVFYLMSALFDKVRRK